MLLARCIAALYMYLLRADYLYFYSKSKGLHEILRLN